MRRTTICRSSRAVLLALVAGLLGVPGLGAQDTTRAAADTSQAPAAPAGQVPESHVVTRGETLWSISQLYFGDPLLWPEIYRLNTAVVEDPHWIYPGEVQHLARIDPVRVFHHRSVQPVDLGPEERIAEVQLRDRPEGLTPRDDVALGHLPRGGRRGLGSVGGGSGRVLRPKPRHTEQPCNKGEQDCPARTADRRPPHRAPPGTRRAIPVCLRERPWPRPGCAQTRLHLRRFHEATAGSLPVR